MKSVIVLVLLVAVVAVISDRRVNRYKPQRAQNHLRSIHAKIMQEEEEEELSGEGGEHGGEEVTGGEEGGEEEGEEGEEVEEVTGGEGGEGVEEVTGGEDGEDGPHLDCSIPDDLEFCRKSCSLHKKKECNAEKCMCKKIKKRRLGMIRN